MSARGYSKEILHSFNHGFYGSPDPADLVHSIEEIAFTESETVYENKYDNDTFSADDSATVSETDLLPDVERLRLSESARLSISHHQDDSFGLSEHAWSFTPQYSNDQFSASESEDVGDIQLIFIEDIGFSESSGIVTEIRDSDRLTIVEDAAGYAKFKSSDGFGAYEDWGLPIVSIESSDKTSMADRQFMSASAAGGDSFSLVDRNDLVDVAHVGSDTFSYEENSLQIQFKYGDDSFSAIDNETFYLAPHPHRLVLGGNVVMGQWVSGDNIDTDVSGWRNHANINDVAYVRPLEVGGYHSLHFHGTSSFRVPLSYPLDSYPPRFTVSLWFRAELDGTLVASDGMWAIGLEAQSIVAQITDRFGFTRSGTLVENIEYGRSYHLAVVFAGDINTCYSYLDSKGQGSFSIEGIKKLEMVDDGVIRLGQGPYGRFDGEMDNIHMLAGSVPPDEVEEYYEKATRTQDFLESVQAQRPILILSYDASSEDQEAFFEPTDIAMTKFLVDETNFTLNSHTWHPIIWTEEYFTGAQLDHAGYLSLNLKPPEEVEHHDFIPSIEFVVDDMLNATGTIFEINFQGDDMFRARAEDGLLIVEEINALGIFWFIEIEASERMHCIINMDEEDVYIYVNGYVRASLSPQQRTPFESIKMLGNGTDPFTGIAGPIIMYEEPVHRFVITQHFDIAYGGNTAVQYSETSTVTVGADAYADLMYDWTMVPA